MNLISSKHIQRNSVFIHLNPHTTRRAISLLESGAIDTDKIISAELNLEEMGEELKTLKNSRKGKVMVRLSGEL